MDSSYIEVRRSAEGWPLRSQCNTVHAAGPEAAASPAIDAGYTERLTWCQRAGVAVSRPILVTVSVWPAGTTAEYSAVQHEGQQYWRNTMGAST
jgi:hypothetical protein